MADEQLQQPTPPSERIGRRISTDPSQKRLGVPANSAANHAFSTKSALVGTAVTLVLMALLSLTFSESSPLLYSNSHSQQRWLETTNTAATAAAADNNNSTNTTDYSKYSCYYIYEKTPIPGADQCKFATQCNQGAGLWGHFAYCSNTFTTTFLVALISPVMILWLILLFRMLGSTAEDYFSPALEMFSVKLGLPPRFAGVTLLALGNGAADVSATVSAITSDPELGYQLALGALTGAAMVISVMVSAVVVLVADGVPCRGALLRDVAMLSITVALVWWQLSSGTVGTDTMNLFLSIYLVFVVLVLVADVYHRTVVLPRLAVRAQDDERNRQLEAQRLQESMIPSVPSNHFSRAITALSNYDNLDVPQDGWGVESDDLAQDRPIMLHGAHGILRGDGIVVPPEEQAETQDGGEYSILDETVDRYCVARGSYGAPATNWAGAFEDGRAELVEHAYAVWDDIVWNGDVHAISKVLLIIELPFTILRKITVPIPCEGYYVRGLVALSLPLSPLWFAYYLWDGHGFNVLANGGWLYFLILFLFFCIGALCVLRFAPGGEGSMSLVFSTPIALYGFAIAATWIDSIANSLVAVLNFVGIILKIPAPVVGLTILAWGNSMGDLSANVTMARKGLGNMAMTACFAGPVFNILVGLGFGFGSLAAMTDNARATVTLSKSAKTGFVFLILNSILILTTGLVWGKGRISKTYGYSALALYSVYAIASIYLQYTSREKE
jgi:solute carrier family 24 (sodium/potassium/calcium exchanger), member 6